MSDTAQRHFLTLENARIAQGARNHDKCWPSHLHIHAHSGALIQIEALLGVDFDAHQLANRGALDAICLCHVELCFGFKRHWHALPGEFHFIDRGIKVSLTRGKDPDVLRPHPKDNGTCNAFNAVDVNRS